MAHSPFHRPGQWDTGYFSSLPATNPNTRGRYAVDFSKQRPYQVIGVNRRPEYLNQGGTGILNTVQNQANTPAYDFWGSKLGGGLIGTASDIAEGVGYLGEGLKTGYNYGQLATDKFINKPIADLLVDPSGTMPGSLRTTEEIDKDIANLDTTFDKPQAGGALGSDFAEYSNVRKVDWSNLTKNIMESDTWKGMYEAADELYPETDLKKDIPTLTDSSQTEVSQSINEIPIFNQDVSDASSTLANALDSKKEIDMSDPDEKQTWQSRVNNGINGFMDRLGDPGFQTALAMHMEAKNGGDATDVLFAGVKTNTKVQSAMMQSRMNELNMQLLETKIADNLRPEEPSKADLAMVTGILTGKGGEFELSQGDAAVAAPLIASLAEAYIKAGYDQGTATQAAIAEYKQSGQLKGQDTAAWYWKALSFLPGTQSRGSFNLSSPTSYNPGASNVTRVTTNEEYNALPSGTAYIDINGITGIKP